MNSNTPNTTFIIDSVDNTKKIALNLNATGFHEGSANSPEEFKESSLLFYSLYADLWKNLDTIPIKMQKALATCVQCVFRYAYPKLRATERSISELKKENQELKDRIQKLEDKLQ